MLKDYHKFKKGEVIDYLIKYISNDNPTEEMRGRGLIVGAGQFSYIADSDVLYVYSFSKRKIETVHSWRIRKVIC